LALAEILGDFVSIVGGPKKAHSLLVPLKTLCNVEESTVRDKAVASLNKIASQMKPEMIETHFTKLIEELLSEKWFTSKSSACGLFGVVYPVVTDEKKTQLRA
jgi:serine/threonine-protein phosphatase 2A regulatory subunit A